jgi:parallel beta-helix repeat protein
MTLMKQAFFMVAVISFIAMMNIQFVAEPKAETRSIYIRPSGEVEGTDKILWENGVYLLTANLVNETVVVERSHIIIDGCGHEIQGLGSGAGFRLVDLKNVTIENVHVQSFFFGFYCKNTTGCFLRENTATNNHYGVYLYDSNDDIVLGNRFSWNEHGISLYRSADNALIGNNVTANGDGVILSSSLKTILSENLLVKNTYSMHVWGSELIHFIHSIDVSNRVDGKPMYYLINQSNITLTQATHPTVGFLALINSTFATIKNLTLTGNKQGLLLAYTTNLTVLCCRVTANGEGISLYHSSHNMIYCNEIKDNALSIRVRNSNSNTFFRNNLINNNKSVSVYESVNTWDNGVEGNFWGINTLFDSNHDGISDAPHELLENNTDHYPLMARNTCYYAEEDKSVNVISNFNIEDCHFNDAITLRVSGEETLGFCRVSIPHSLINVSDLFVVIDGGVTSPLYLNYSLHDNGTHRWIYFAFENSPHEIQIIQEFPIPTLFLILTLTLPLLCKRKHRKSFNCSRDLQCHGT